MIGLTAVTFGLLLILGIPIFVAMALPALIGTASIGVPLTVVTQRMFGGIDKFSLMAIPFFVLGANLMGRGGMAKRIISCVEHLAGRLHGGVAIVTVLSCMFFGTLSGSANATVAAIGEITYPMLLKNRYSKRFSLGLIVSSAVLASIIPPSINMILYASVTGVSVGKLFIAGFGPGVVLGVISIIYCYRYAKVHDLKEQQVIEWVKAKQTARDASWAIGVPLIILGGIYLGVFTPTESATVAAVYGLIVCLYIYRELTWKSLWEVCEESAIVTSLIMMLVAASSALSWSLTVGGIEEVVTNSIKAVGPKWMTLLIMNLIMLIAGMFMDCTPFIILLAPVFASIGRSVGIDLIHLGIIMVVNAGIGFFTPPFGLNLFVAASVFKEPYDVVSRAAIPFVFLYLIGLAIITYFPGISLWLPGIIYGR